MSQIYRATSAQDKTVIIKILNYSKTESPQKIKQRLALEGLVSSKLKHPSICKTLDYAFDDEGHYGLVLENLVGQNLNVILKKRSEPFSLKDSLLIITELAQALHYAHGQSETSKTKIIHRDLKPSNIFITDEMQIKLLDFGISTEMDSRFQSLKINQGFTKCYTPPDLWVDKNFEHNSYTEAHDIYCLGLIFYELLTKEKAFKSLTDNMQGSIPCLSSHGYDQQELISLFKKWTHLIPSERFNSADELLKALGNLKIDRAQTRIIKLPVDFAETNETQPAYTEIDSTLFTYNEYKLSSVEEIFALNILWFVQKKIQHSEIEKELKRLVEIVGQKSNQTYFNYNNLDLITFSIRAMASVKSTLFKTLNPNLLFSDFETLTQMLEGFKIVLKSGEAYVLYSMIYKTLQRTNALEVPAILMDIRASMNLDPLECDDEKNCEGFQESLSALLFLKLNVQHLETTKKFIQDSVRLDKTPKEAMILDMLYYFCIFKKTSFENASDFDKQVIAFTLSTFAYADKKIDAEEKKFLDSQFARLKWKSTDFKLILNKDKDSLLWNLQQERQTQCLVFLLEFLLIKGAIVEKEFRILAPLFQQYIEYAKRLPLKVNSQYILLEFFLDHFSKLKSNQTASAMVLKLTSVIPNFSESLYFLNQIRGSVTSFPTKNMNEMAEIHELLKEKMTKKDDPLFHLHLYYLFLRLSFFPKNDLEKMLLKSNVATNKKIPIEHFSRDFDALLNWKIPYFIFKYIIRCSISNAGFNEKIQTSEFRRDLYGLMFELRINDKNLNFAKRMIRSNYGEQPFLKD